MKKLLLIALVFIASQSFSQTRYPLHLPYVGGSVGLTPASNQFAFSVESGIWGIESPTSYALMFATVQNPETNGFDKFIGAKAYYTFAQIGRPYFMAYIAPQIKINSNALFVMEEGVTFNIPHKKIIYSAGVGVQQAKGYSPFVPTFGVSLTRLLF